MTNKIDEVLIFLLLLIVVATAIERSLGFLFDARPIRGWVSEGGRLRIAKPWLALGLSAAIVIESQSDLLKVLYPGRFDEPTMIGLALTSLFVAGGSAGLIGLFQNVFSMSKAARSAQRTKQAVELAAKLRSTSVSGPRRVRVPRIKPGAKVGFSE